MKIKDLVLLCIFIFLLFIYKDHSPYITIPCPSLSYERPTIIPDRPSIPNPYVLHTPFIITTNPFHHPGPCNHLIDMVNALALAKEFRAVAVLYDIPPHHTSKQKGFQNVCSVLKCDSYIIERFATFDFPKNSHEFKKCTDIDCARNALSIRRSVDITDFDICSLQTTNGSQCPAMMSIIKQDHLFLFRHSKWHLNFTHFPEIRKCMCLHIRLDDDFAYSQVDLETALFTDVFDKRTVAQFRENGVPYEGVTFVDFIKGLVNDSDLYLMTSNSKIPILFRNHIHSVNIYDISNFTTDRSPKYGDVFAVLDRVICSEAYSFMQTQSSFSKITAIMRRYREQDNHLWRYYYTLLNNSKAGIAIEP